MGLLSWFDAPSTTGSGRARTRTIPAVTLLLGALAAVSLAPSVVRADGAPAQASADIPCEDVTPVVFTPAPSTLDLLLDRPLSSTDTEAGASGDDSAAVPSASIPDDASAGDISGTGDRQAKFFVSFTLQPGCEWPTDGEVVLAHSVLLSGPTSATRAPLITASDVAFTETVVFNGAVEVLGSIELPDLSPGNWTGTLPLVFVTGADTAPTELGTASLPLSVKEQQNWNQGASAASTLPPWLRWVVSPFVLFLLAIVGGLALGLYRMLSATENPDEIALVRRTDDRPVAITWRWRNVAALGFGLAAGVTAWVGVYWRDPAFAVTWDSSLALFAAVGGATLTAFVAAFAPPTASDAEIKKAKSKLPRKPLELSPGHGRAGTEVTVTGPSIRAGRVMYFGASDHHPIVRNETMTTTVPSLGTEKLEVYVSIVDNTTGERLGEAPFKYEPLHQ